MEDTSFEPDSLKFEIQGWFSRFVEWLPDYRLISYGSGGPEDYRRPTADEWRAFWAAIDEADVWDWGRSYREGDGMCDAGDWTLVLAHESFSMRSRGDEMNRPPEWPSLLMALGVLADDDYLIEYARSTGTS